MNDFLNEDIANYLKSLAFLMEAEGNQNPFRVRSFQKAADVIIGQPAPLGKMTVEELEKIPGIGKGIASVIKNYILHGTCKEWEEITAIVPESLLEMKDVRGLGPGRIRKLWKEGGIKSIRNLKKAAKDNPELLEKILGKTTALKIINELDFLDKNKGKKLFFQVWPIVKDFIERHRERFPDLQPADDLFTMQPVIGELSFYVSPQSNKKEILFTDFENHTGIRCSITEHYINTDKGPLLGNSDFILSVKEKLNDANVKEKNKIIDFAFSVPKELRIYPLDKLKNLSFTDLVESNDIKGLIHSHTTWSDGKNSIEEMAAACQKEGWQWLVVSDHSRSAYYANGLKEPDVLKQKEEIRQINKKIKNFRIIHGIESDILKDGSLDYPDEILKEFEVIIASVHSGLQMNEAQATERIIKAIENPYTHILGHLTGRLLLERRGYPVHHKKIIDACAANGVAIELNTNPYRLDIDYEWIPCCMEKGVKLCLSPDAHSVEGLRDIYYGITVARKGFMVKDVCLNLLSAEEFLNCIRKK
jgi:DNA polymerase (family 10)